MPEGEQRAGRLRVRVSDERGRAVPLDGLGPWLARIAPARARGDVSVALVSDRRVRALNRLYRRKDYATDVLSFPAFARSKSVRASARQARRPRLVSPQPPVPSPFLGDIVIARGVARRQAREAGHSERTEIRVLALHGLLHLLGYDHERDQGRMLRVERRLRRKGGLREGLIERAR
jgi:probable rRNA maturation factor